jgi:NAD(P)-dependent dehydrogenase (short-subunit alcohol dehydrogenase family)
MSKKAPKVVLVTGSSSGFGMLAAVEMAKRGHRVYASMRNTKKADALLQAAQAAQTSVHLLALDVTNTASIAAAVSEVEEKEGHIDVLVNNAGVSLGIGFFEEVSPADFEAVMATNFMGAVAVTRAVLPGMRVRKSGAIINVSSIYGFMGCATGSAYASSKWALEGFSESLRFEMDPFGVKVSLVEPGYFATPILGENMTMSQGQLDPKSPYFGPLQAGMKYFQEKILPKVGDPKVVATLLADVAEKKNPKLRYVVGKDGVLLRRMRSMLPASTFEGIFIGVGKKGLEYVPVLPAATEASKKAA